MSDGYGPCIQIASLERDPSKDCVDVTYTVHWAERQGVDAFSSDMSLFSTCPSQLAVSGSTQTESDEQIRDLTEKSARDEVLQESSGYYGYCMRNTTVYMVRNLSSWTVLFRTFRCVSNSFT